MKNFLISFFCLGCFALSAAGQTSEVFAPSGIAINGYDVVAFFKEAKTVKGNSEYNYTWKNVLWYFSSKVNLDSFKISPDRFAPQFGGYCAYGTAKGHKAPTEIETWTIVDGKLYFNYNSKVKQLWDKNQQNYIDSALIKWPLIKDSKL